MKEWLKMTLKRIYEIELTPNRVGFLGFVTWLIGFVTYSSEIRIFGCGMTLASLMLRKNQ